MRPRVCLTIISVFLLCMGTLFLLRETPKTETLTAVEAVKQPTMPQKAEKVVVPQPEPQPQQIVATEQAAPKTNAVVVLTGRISAE